MTPLPELLLVADAMVRLVAAITLLSLLRR